MMVEPTEAEPRPSRVTRLVPDPRRPGSVRVEVNGRPFFTVPAAALREFGVAVGVVLEGPRQAGLCRAADAEAAYRTALRCLERRPFAARDLARRLVVRGHPPEAAEGAVQRAADAGLVNDAVFARHFVQTRFARGRGPARLRRELTALGVAPSVVDQVLAEELPDEAARDRMVALVRRRAGQLDQLPPPVRFRRVVAYLARRGYAGAAVRETVRALLG